MSVPFKNAAESVQKILVDQFVPDCLSNGLWPLCLICSDNALGHKGGHPVLLNHSSLSPLELADILETCATLIRAGRVKLKKSTNEQPPPAGGSSGGK